MRVLCQVEVKTVSNIGFGLHHSPRLYFSLSHSTFLSPALHPANVLDGSRPDLVTRRIEL